MKNNQDSIALDYTVSALRDIATLVKFRLTLLVVFSAAMGYLITAAQFNVVVFGLLILGGFFITAAANTLNQVLEKDYDILMARTMDRPLPAGRMKTSYAVFLAGIFCLVGVTALGAIHPIAGLLGMTSMVLYSFVYTPMKRYSTLSIWIGGIPGALPIMIGCVAAQGAVTPLALGLFALQYFWQLPHFWSIGYLAFEDYSKANFKVMPMKDDRLDTQIGLYSVAICGFMALLIGGMYYLSLLSFMSALILVTLTVLYGLASLDFHKKFNRDSARKLMFASFLYLPAILITLIIF